MEDELTGILSKLVEFIESASPVIWEAAQGQVVAYITTDIIWAVVWAATAYALFRLGRFCWALAGDSRRDEEIWGVGAGFSFLTSAGAAFGAMFLATEAIKMAINPTYYAIRALLALVP